mgnify:CR=1 FL=1
MKISVEQLKQLNKEEYILIDIRDAEEAFKKSNREQYCIKMEKVFYSKEFSININEDIVVCAQAMQVMLLHKNCRKNMKRIV